MNGAFMNIMNFVKFVFIIGVIYFFITLGLNRIDKYIEIKAIDDCGKISQYQKNLTSENARVSYPIVDVYKNCLKDKGYK